MSGIQPEQIGIQMDLPGCRILCQVDHMANPPDPAAAVCPSVFRAQPALSCMKPLDELFPVKVYLEVSLVAFGKYLLSLHLKEIGAAGPPHLASQVASFLP